MSLPLHIYDIVMIAVLIFSTVFGLWKGMAWQLAAFASLILSAVVAVYFSGPVAPYIGLQAPLNRWVAMLLIYLVAALVIWVLFRMVSGAIDRVRLKEFDHQMGALFGLAKGVLWCLIITFFAVTLSEPLRQSVLNSRSGYYIALLIHRADPIMPDEIRAVLGKYIDELEEKLEHGGEGEGEGGHRLPDKDASTPPGESSAEDFRGARDSREKLVFRGFECLADRT